MVTVSATKARGMFYQLINEPSEPITITGKHGNKILVDEDEWRGIEETIYLNSIPGMQESIIAAHESDDVVSEDEIGW